MMYLSNAILTLCPLLHVVYKKSQPHSWADSFCVTIDLLIP